MSWTRSLADSMKSSSDGKSSLFCTRFCIWVRPATSVMEPSGAM